MSARLRSAFNLLMKNPTSSLKNWKGSVAVIGVDWGDSGKGRLIDDLSANADIVARYNGGANTGHTIDNKFGKFALHIMPSGIFTKKAICLVGRNSAVDLESLMSEMKMLKSAGLSFRNLVIDGEAHLVMPWHKMRDSLREKLRSFKVGTTGKGIGPVYSDRTERVGLLVKDLASSHFEENLKKEISIQNKLYNLKLNSKNITNSYKAYSRAVKKYIGNTTAVIRKAHKDNKNILFEGAQGYFLDIDSGTYPYVTSSNPGVVGIFKSYDFHPSSLDQVIGITKAYTTRVGEGPLPTKMEEDIAKTIIEVGKEFGTTTGRIRLPGWLDLVLLREAAYVNRLTSLAITKLDVLSKIKKIKLCTSYKIGSNEVSYVAHDSDLLYKVKPQYMELEGWDEDISKIRNFAKLPKNAQKFIIAVENFTNVSVKFVSVGPKRGQVIYK